MLVHTMKSHGGNVMNTDKNMLLKTQKAHKIDMIQAKAWDYAEVSRFASYEHKSMHNDSAYNEHKNNVLKMSNNKRMIISSDRKKIYIYSSKEKRWIPYKASARSIISFISSGQ